MKDVLRSVWFDASGQDVAEYALLLAVILAVVVGTVTAIGTQANVLFTNVKTALGG
jgi:Flp pilus assembly pilin Flp